MKLKFFFALCFLAAISLQAQYKQTASVEGITEYQLDNGLKVLLFPDNSSQTITVNITYLVGSRHEGYGEKGMAHLLEHLVFKGTPNHPDIPKELSSHGARPNGTTYYDRTNYFETFNATEENLDWALDLESDRMMNSFIAQEDLESEFTVVRNEFESGENSPFRVLIQKVTDAAYLWHNYGNSTIGNRSDIERVPIENLKEFYRKFYRPDNAVLMITGKFENEAMMEKVVEKFGPLKAPDMPIRDSYTEEPAQDGEKRVTVSRVGDIQLVASLYHGPAGSHPDYAAMAIVEEVLTDEPSGRLYKALVESQKASSVWSFSPFLKEPGFIFINAEVPSDKDADEVERILKETLDGLKDNPITEEELKRAQANLAKSTDQMMRNSSFLGLNMSEYIGAGDWRLAFITRDRVAEATLEHVNKVAAKYFIPSNRTIGRFMPTENPVRVEIPHTQGLEELVTSYKGKEDMGTGEAFDVSYDNIQQRLDQGQLDNGIQYGFIEKQNRANAVNLNFSMRNGDVNSLMNKGVIPGFTAQMLNKGTTSRSRQQIEDELSALKSSIFLTGRNGNVYAYISSTKENLMPTVELMTDMIKNPAFDPAELEKLKTERIAALELNKTEPQSVAGRRLSEINNHYPKGHPNYAMSLEEEMEAIKAVTIDDLKQFYNDFYGLGKSITIGIGTFESEEVKAYLQKEFAGFDDAEDYAEIKSPFHANNVANENIITPDKKNAITFGVLGVKMSQDDKDYPALQIAATVFGGGFLNSRVAERLRQKDGVSYGAGASLNADSDKDDQNSSLFVYAIYNPMNLDKVQLGFTEETQRFIDGGITEEELTNAVNGWIQGQNVSRAKDNELASVINNNIYYSRDMSYQKEMEAKVSALTVADVNAAIKKYFKPFSEWTVVNAGDYNAGDASGTEEE
ncbi:zinc protease [Robiginitalea myxolifaciens]|uniref:Zinc protease n=1 Tax=Robiginitalea myxolifaciens TaxID=400055 RepID=A0A1I6FUI4_9FLAO|nr:pitrilysin family protein [Robiginitalea myxolifaciens]SFR33609.1 zinc protease [Robiginitalea myxolifaciens]